MACDTLGVNSTTKIVKAKYVIFSNFSVIFWNLVVEITIIIIIIIIIIVIISSSSSSIFIIIIIIIIFVIIVIIVTIILNRVIVPSISIWTYYI